MLQLYKLIYYDNHSGKMFTFYADPNIMVVYDDRKDTTDVQRADEVIGR